MSYDLNCYLTPSGVPVPQTVPGPTWQLAVYPPTPIDAEDMPPALVQAIGTRTHLVNLHIEGKITAAAKKAFNALMDQLIFDHDAVVHDLQQDTLESRDGIKPLPAEPPKPKPKPLRMSFLFTCRPGERDAVRAKFLDTVERVAPKAMPRRFGSYEPMPYTLEKDGRDCLLEDWAENESFYFWRGTAPYQHAYTGMPDPFTRHPSSVGRFAACNISLELSPRVLTTKKDKADMLALFAALCGALDVFYAEISNRTVYGGWRGVPDNGPLAQCIGASYAAIWPAFCDGAQMHGDGHWVRDAVIAEHEMPAIPEDLRDPDEQGWKDPGEPVLYAPQFPFDLPDPKRWQLEPWEKELVLRVATLRHARAFYTGLLPVMGSGITSEDGPFIGYGWEHHSFRMEKAKPPVEPQHVVFKAKSERMVHAFFDKALSLGATELSPPRMRPEKGDWYYACEVSDLDGHRVEMLFRG